MLQLREILGRFCTLAVVLLLTAKSLVEAGRPSAMTPAGTVRGVWVEATGGAPRFAAYLGIPYASPPVGTLRFKHPRPPTAWNGEFDASTDPPVCPQRQRVKDRTVVIGQEDCLYLNVYAQEVNEARSLLPVIVVVHGGFFEHGSGRMDQFGPHFLMKHEVVVVSVNYRLGALGFLNTDTEAVPGNAGLKDLKQALSWVASNIVGFGGDAKRVTGLGWSSGAVAIHQLALLPATRGLLSRAVLIAGHAISPRAYSERHLERAQALASLLGAKDNSSQEVHSALQTASVQQIMEALDTPRMREIGYMLPSPERRATPQGEGAGAGPEPRLLTQDPESLLRAAQTPPMPTILGLAAREGLGPYYYWGLSGRTDAALDELLPRLMPADLLPGKDTANLLGIESGSGTGPLDKDAALRLAQLVRDEYTGGGPIAADRDREAFIQFLGDAYISASSWRAAGFLANMSTEDAPFRMYSFNVDDKYNYIKKLEGITQPGATHVDDIGYLGRFAMEPDLGQSMESNSTASITLHRMTTMVTDFAKGRNQDFWPVVRPRLEVTSWPVLNVGPERQLRSKHSAGGAHSAFWNSIYKDFRSKTPNINAKLKTN